MSVHTEIELKLRASAAALEQVLQLDWLQALCEAPPLCQRYFSIYYDTPELSLRQQGIALRVRQVGTQWMQTIKSRGQEKDGLSVRQEWECAITEHHLDFSALDDSTLKTFLQSESTLNRIKPRFVTEFERQTQPLRCTDGTLLELALDRGEVRAGGRSTPIMEIELELLQGDPQRITHIGRCLQDALAVVPESCSKAERGYRLLLDTPP